MSTSNVSTFQITRNELIETALRKIGVLAEGISANATQLTTGQLAANLIIKQLQTKGMQSWKKTTLPITLLENVSTYEIGLGQTVNTALPLKLTQAYLTSISNSIIDLEIESDYNFNILPSNSFGTPVKVSYLSKINSGTLRVWPTPNASAVLDYVLNIVYQKPFDIFISSAETIDVAEEWQLSLVYKLAHQLADDYQLPLEDRLYIKKQADDFTKEAEEFSTEDTSTYIYPRKS